MLTPPHLPALVHERIRLGRFRVSSHVLRHGAAEGFTVRDVLTAVEQGMLIEDFPDRSRCPFCGRVRIASGRLVWLHVVCDYNHPVEVGIITAYEPDLREWEHPPVRRRAGS
jgi:hypothetical protein